MLKEIFDLKEKLKKTGKRGLALDIDETLSVTRNKYFEIMAEELGNPENFSVEEFVAKYIYTWNVPYWTSKEEFKPLASRLVIDEEIHRNIDLIHGADDGVAEIDKHIPIVCYITARPDVISNVTKEWLAKHRFPTAELIMKTRFVENFNAWKAEILEFLYPEVIGIVDDNPSLIEELSADYKGTVFLYENSSPNNRSLNIEHCADWKDVVKKVANYAI